MSNAQFAIAKFIPDMKRHEPRNFGVVVWNRGDCASRFLGDDKSEDGRDFSRLGISDKRTYFQWVEYWRIQLSKAEFRLRNGDVVPRTEPGFLDAICETSLENFRLSNAGFLSMAMPKAKTSDIAKSLFDALVLNPTTEKQDASENTEALRKQTNSALDASGLSDNPDFKRTYDWLCPVGDTLQHFRFHFAVHRAKPHAVMQKVNLHRQASVNDAAFMFQAMQQKYFGKERCAAIVYAEESDLRDDAVFQAYKMMGAFGEVVNVADQPQAIKQFAALAV